MALSLIITVPVLLLILVLFGILLKYLLRNRDATPIILLGIQISIIGIYFSLSTYCNLNGYEIIIVLAGFVCSLTGLLKKEH
ncbi:MAG: hypothetical protein E7255_01595 [Lachnospiraceae bacterium]|nr:hypothetical protein [Lachnospiraceae bacterium]